MDFYTSSTTIWYSLNLHTHLRSYWMNFCEFYNVECCFFFFFFCTFPFFFRKCWWPCAYCDHFDPRLDLSFIYSKCRSTLVPPGCCSVLKSLLNAQIQFGLSTLAWKHKEFSSAWALGTLAYKFSELFFPGLFFTWSPQEVLPLLMAFSHTACFISVYTKD